MGKPTESRSDAFYCAELSVQKNEQLFATATRADNWLLLSYNGTFTRKPLDDANIPTAVKNQLTTAARNAEHTRIQLIKQVRNPDSKLVFYVARVGLPQPRLYRFEVKSYDELAVLDLERLLAGSDTYAENLTEAPVFLVCTHGIHDRCCAQWGMPVYTHLSARKDMEVWQTNHIGGHRFAANLLSLPSGTMYGRVTPASADQIVQAHANHSIHINNYRGRTNLDPAFQAAEYYACRESGIAQLEGLNRLGSRTLTDTITEVIFSVGGNEIHTVVQRLPGALRTFTSCGAFDESSIDQYRLIECRISANMN